MDFSALGKKGGGSKKPKKDLPINIAMRLERIEVNTDKPSVFHGYIAGSNEPVKVRMMTVAEGVEVNRRVVGREGNAAVMESVEAATERLKAQYVGTGERHRPRPAEIANPENKTHCEAGGLIMFTKCMRNEDGSYRAHWAETMERSAGAGCDKVMANIRVEEMKDKASGAPRGTQVVADVVNPSEAVVVNKSNLVHALTSVFANRNGEEKRKPFAFVRLINAETGANILPPARASAKYLESEVTDPDSGEKFKRYDAAAAEESIKNLFDSENTSQDAMVIRAALFGFGNEEGYPVYKDVTNEALVGDLKKITDGVRSGAIQVEVIPGERISAGPATRASIEKAVKSNANHPINTLYVGRNSNGYPTERRYLDTFLTTRVGKDGYRYFTKAVAADVYPSKQTIATLATVNDHKAQAEAAKARAAEASAAEVVVDDEMLLDPSTLDGTPGDDLDAKLSQSAAALEAGIV